MSNHPAEGGSYVINGQGERVRVEPPTQDHPDGNRARPLDIKYGPLDELITDADLSVPASAKTKRAK